MLPEILTSYDFYIWFDADTWLQSDDVIKVMHQAQNVIPWRIFVTPGTSYCNASMYDDMTKIIRMQIIWFETYYQGSDLCDAFSKKMHYSCGLFCISRIGPVWNLWKKEIIKPILWSQYATIPFFIWQNRHLLILLFIGITLCWQEWTRFSISTAIPAGGRE